MPGLAASQSGRKPKGDIGGRDRLGYPFGFGAGSVVYARRLKGVAVARDVKHTKLAKDKHPKL